jgi:hypothetical protein
MQARLYGIDISSSRAIMYLLYLSHVTKDAVMAVIKKNYQTLIIIVLALSIIGTILVLFTPFGGMTVSTYYGLRERYASLFSEYSEPLDNLFIVLLAICMLVTAILSFVELKSTQLKPRKTIRLAWFFSVLTLFLAIVGGVTYEVVRAGIGYEDWWLDTGFYAGIITGLLNSTFYTVILRKTK